MGVSETFLVRHPLPLEEVYDKDGYWLAIGVAQGGGLVG